MTDPQPSKRKKTIYRATGSMGIRSIWDWSEKAQDYIQRKTGNRYQAYIQKNGRTYSESFGSILEAGKWRTRLMVDLERMPETSPITFKGLFDVFLEFKKSNVRLTTYESYICLTRHLRKLWPLNVEDINAKTIDAWLREVKSIEYRTREKVRSTRTSYLHEVDLLKLIFGYYKEYINERFENPIRARHIKDSVFDKKRVELNKAKEKIKYISTDDIEVVISTFRGLAESKPKKKIYYVACLLQLRTGMRIGEVFSLNWEDIVWDTSSLVVSKTVQWMRLNKRATTIGDVPKNGKNRTIFLVPDILEELKNLKKFQGRNSGLVFSEDGKSVPAYSSIKHCYDQAMKKANVNHTSTHIMRHSFATHFMETTKDPVALKGILGHSNLRMTDKYAKVTDKSVLDGMRKFEEAISKKKSEKA